jgi:dihydrofolate reductase
MGRRTFESMSDPLDGRRNIVITGDPGFSAPGAEVARSLDEALELTADAEERLLIGGAAIYAAGLEFADRLYLTFVHAEVEGDVLFPEFDEKDWVEVERTEYAANERHEFAFSVVTLDRR